MLYIGVIDQTYKLKMHGWILPKFVEIDNPPPPPAPKKNKQKPTPHQQKKKKKLGQYQALLTRTCLASKLFITLPRELYPCATQSGISRGGKVSNPDLAHLGSRSEHRIRYYLARSQNQPIVKQLSTRYICSLLVR